MKTTQYKLYLIFTLLLYATSFVQAQEQRTLTILQTSDTHSRIDPIDKKANDRNAGLGGIVRRATMVDQLRKEIPTLLLFDCGDFSQGTPYYNFYQGEVEVKLMNFMRYDAVMIGNHEFDFGMENLAKLFEMAWFPIVCSNYDVTNTPLEGLVKPYITIRRNNLKIGVFGLGVKLEGLVQKDKCEGIVFQEPVTVANEMAEKLRKKEKCDVVICLSHLGVYDDRELIKNTRNIDLVLGGHTHTFMSQPEEIPNMDNKNVSLFHSGKSGIYVSRTDLKLKKTK